MAKDKGNESDCCHWLPNSAVKVMKVTVSFRLRAEFTLSLK